MSTDILTEARNPYEHLYTCPFDGQKCVAIVTVKYEILCNLSRRL